MILYLLIAQDVLQGPIQVFNLLEDAEEFRELKDINSNILDEIIQRSIKAKAKIVALDELEGGIRAILNYGHTFGHVIESLCGYGKWLHGEAVSIGMVAVGQLALDLNIWSEIDALRQEHLLSKIGLPVKWPNLDPVQVINLLKSDKKVLSNKVRFIIPRSIGSVFISDDITEEQIIKSLSRIS